MRPDGTGHFASFAKVCFARGVGKDVLQYSYNAYPSLRVHDRSAADACSGVPDDRVCGCNAWSSLPYQSRFDKFAINAELRFAYHSGKHAFECPFLGRKVQYVACNVRTGLQGEQDK